MRKAPIIPSKIGLSSRIYSQMTKSITIRNNIEPSMGDVVQVVDDTKGFPSDLTLEQNDNIITLTWNDGSTNEQSILIERSLDGQNFVGINVVPADNVTYDDDVTGIEAEYIYYRVTTIRGFDYSRSEVLKATLLNLPDWVKAYLPANIPTVNIGSQDWQLKNFDLEFTPLNNILPEVTDNSAWAALTTEGYRHVNNDSANNSVYGKLLNYFAVAKVQADIDAYNVLHPASPIRFRVSNDWDYLALSQYLGGASIAGGKMKSVGEEWLSNIGATNSSGFTAIPSGAIDPSGSSVLFREYSLMYVLNGFVGENPKDFYLTNVNTILGVQNISPNYGLSLRLIKSDIITGNVGILGDSTIGNHLILPKVSNFLTVCGTLTDVANSGDTIANQQIKWDALSAQVKLAMNYVFVQVGINSLSDISVCYTDYQALINSIRLDSPSATIIAGTMTPCKSGLNIAWYNNWVLLNDAIMGNGANAITGIDVVSSSHTTTLNDGSDNLLALYNTGDNIHENELGRLVILKSWLSSL